MTEAVETDVAAGSHTPPVRRLRIIDSLTGLRFFAAAWVVVLHYSKHIESIFPVWRDLRPFTQVGFLGVDVFFILSGFVISYNYSARFRSDVKWGEYRKFLWLRFARIYPVHLVTLLFLLCIVIAAEVAGQQLNHSYGAVDFVRNLFMVHAWENNWDVINWNYPSWSISAEWFAYLLFPLAARAFRSVCSVPATIAAASVSLSLLLIVPPVLHVSSPLLQITSQFLAGMFLAHLYQVTRPSGWWDMAAVVAVVAGLLIALTLEGRLESGLFSVAASVGIISLAHARRGLPTVLAHRRIVFLGEASYALYMTHGVIDMVVGKLLPMENFAASAVAVRLAIVGVYLLLLAGATVGLHLLVELPARDRLRRVRIARAA